MLKKDNRLTKKKDFDRVFSGGRSSFDELCGVKAMKQTGGTAKIGFIVGNKVSKKAVERNLIKRRMRAAASSFLLLFAEGADIIVIALPKVKEAGYQEIERSLGRHFKKLKIIK